MREKFISNPKSLTFQMGVVGTEYEDKKQARSRLKKVLKIGGTYAITLPKDFAAGAEYLLLVEAGDGLFIKKVKIVESGGPPPPPTPHRRRGEPP
jgi:hypothetical protein